jgi:hypothetical protein
MDNLFLEEMRSVWQESSPPGTEPSDDSPNWQDLLAGLRRYERQVLRVNVAKTIGGVVTLLLAGGILLPGHIDSWLVLGGLSWVALSTLSFIIVYWRWQFRVGTLPLDRSALELIRLARHGLMRERTLFWRFMPLFGLAMIVGLQVVYLGILRNEPPTDRLLFHVLSALTLLAVLAGALRFRRRRFQREMQPLLDRLEQLEASWQENGR